PGETSPPHKADSKSRLRWPVALVLADKDTRLFVANQRGGSISVIDTKRLKTTAEIQVGRKLSDLAATPDGKHLLAVDEEANQLVVLSRREEALKVVHRVWVSPAPVSVRLAVDGSRCFVASLWSRRLTLVDLALKDGDK